MRWRDSNAVVVGGEENENNEAIVEGGGVEGEWKSIIDLHMVNKTELQLSLHEAQLTWVTWS